MPFSGYYLVLVQIFCIQRFPDNKNTRTTRIVRDFVSATPAELVRGGSKAPRSKAPVAVAGDLRAKSKIWARASRPAVPVEALRAVSKIRAVLSAFGRAASRARSAEHSALMR